MTVLLVDDDAGVRLVARLALERTSGWAVTVVASGEEALQVAPSLQPDLVLLDGYMPGMDGLATLGQLRDVGVEAPVVFLTGAMEPEVVRSYLAAGAVGAVPKPFDPLTLADKVRAVLEQAGVPPHATPR